MKKGDTLLVPFPFTDLSSVIIRPALVLAEKSFDVILAFITTKLNWIDDTDLMIEPDSKNGLKTKSIIKVAKIVTLAKNIVVGRLGSITESQVKEIEKNIIKVFKINLQ